MKTDVVPTINVRQMKRRDIIPIQIKRKRDSQRADRLARRRDRQDVSELLLKSSTNAKLLLKSSNNAESCVDRAEENVNLSSTM
jgi:hypothetical protein